MPHYRCSTACFPSASRTDLPYQILFHPIACQSIEMPLGKPARTNPFIDLLGFRVPIQTGPFHPSATAIVGQLDAMPQQRRADPPPPPFRKDEQVLEVERRAGAKGGIALENDRVADRIGNTRPESEPRL